MKRFLIILLILVLTILLAACGGDDGGDEESTDNDQTSEQTTDNDAEEAEEAEAEESSSSGGNTASDGMQMVTVDVDGGTLTFEMRGEWVSDTSGEEIVIANSDAALTADNTVLEAGQMRATIEIIPDGSARLEELGLRDTTPALQFMNTLIEVLDDDALDYELGAARGGMISGSVIAMSTGTVTIEDTTIDAKAFIIDKRDYYAQLIAYAPADEAAQYEGALRNLLGSMELEGAE